jgi:type II secretory pathway pseudopilin PulG
MAISDGEYMVTTARDLGAALKYFRAAANLIDEAVTWGIRRRAATATVTETLDQVLAAIAATPGDPRVLAVIREQARKLSSERTRGSAR